MAVRHPQRFQQGAALLIFVIMLVTAALTYLLNSLTPEAVAARRVQKSADSLVDAREALIGYALQYREQQNQIAQANNDPLPNPVYGFLPTPDLGNLNGAFGTCTSEGCATVNAANVPTGDVVVVGRFPWQTIGTGPLRDGQAECLWYAVSATHRAVNSTATVMNWDTPASPDVLIGSGKTSFTGISAHERPLAVIFSPGPAFDAGRTLSVDAPVCGGNYTDTHYVNAALNNAQHALPISSESLFSAIRKNSYFRQDINSLLDRIVGCLRDEIAAGSGPTGYGKISGADANTCYGSGIPPINYYPNYKEMLYVARGSLSVNGQSCAGTAIFAGQRGTGQVRATTADKNDPANYLEGLNLSGFQASGTLFSGPELFDRLSTGQSAAQDIVRCIPSSASFATVGPNIPGVGTLANYSAAARTLTLGQTISATLPAATAQQMYACAWTPETHAMGGGLRSYFKFRINDAGFSSAATEGISFAIVDGDNNGTDVCGEAAQHMGYSGNNLTTPFIVPPKIGFEIDPRLEGTFNPNASSTLTNGRNDPTTTGGHVGIVYWGGDTTIATTANPPCTAPRINVGGTCVLPQEEDDNVHGQTANTRTGFPSPPANPATTYKLDPSLSQIPVNRDFHVRVELSRTSSAYTVLSARLATTGSNIDISEPGTALDNVVLFSGDRILVKNQTTASENGLYVWSGATTPLTRATDANSAQSLNNSVVEIAQGALNARTLWRQSALAPTPGTDAVRWTPLRVKVTVAQANINLSSPGTKIDNILMKAGDRVLVRNSGVYIWNSATTAMTAATDIVAGAIIQVQQGTEASAWWRYDGSTWQRQSVLVATQENLSLAAPGATIDGVTMATAANKRVLVKTQSNAAQNGIYDWNTDSTPMTRATDADTTTELSGGFTQVISGTDAGRAFRQTTLLPSGTIGGDAVQWTALEGSPSYQLQVWILPDSSTTANQIAALQDTTRPLSILSPALTPQLLDTPKIPYPFRNVRLGFTIGQRRTATDQTVAISNSFTTWIP